MHCKAQKPDAKEQEAKMYGRFQISEVLRQSKHALRLHPCFLRVEGLGSK